MARTIILDLPDTFLWTSRFPSAETVSEDSGWITLYPLGRENSPDVYLHVRQMAAAGGRQALVVCAPTPQLGARLTEAATGATNAWTLRSLRADVRPRAMALKALWRDARRDGETLEILEPVALVGSMAGYGYPQLAEAEEGE